MSDTHRPVEFEPFFAGLQAGALRFPRCTACNRFHWYPMKRCPYCQNGDITWASIAGPGRLHSWTVIRHPFDPDFAAHLPYIVGLVEFDDAPGVRLITHMLPPEPERLCTDMPVLPVFGTDPRTPSPFHFTPRPA